MNDNYEKIIKNKINNYMEQINVPKNLGGIIMEDFEKIKNSEEQNQELKQEGNVNKKPKGKKALKISIAAASAIVLVGVGILVGTKIVGNNTITVNNDGAQNSNMVSSNSEEIKEEKQQISNEESSKLLEFLNNGTNNPFTQIEYSNPESLFINIDKSDPNNVSNILKYAMFSEDNKYFTPTLSSTQRAHLKSIYGDSVDEISWYYISEENLIKFLKEKTNYTYSNEDLRKALNYQETLNGYVDVVSDSAYMQVSISNGYKVGNKYYLTLNQSTTNEDKQMDIVLSESNNIYYFYSCKITTKTSETGKTEISKEESQKILELLNADASTPFLFVNYDEPGNLFKEVMSTLSADSETLTYAIMNSKYSSEPSSSELKILIEGREEMYGSIKVITEENLIKLLKEKMNYTYSTETLRKAFNYNEKINKYVAERSDTLNFDVTIKSGYKLNDKYYLTIPNIPDDGKDAEVVISKANGSYYFYSCKLADGDDQISEQESAKLLKFLNNTVNNPFTQIKYGNPANLFSEIDTSDSYALRYAVFNVDNQYCSELTSAQKSKLKTTKYGSSIDEVPWYFITEENLIKFLKEKTNYTYSTDVLRQVFHYEETVNGYIDCISDTTYLEVSIYSGRKMGDTYSLTLRTAEKEIFMSILEKDGAYYFESCNY